MNIILINRDRMLFFFSYIEIRFRKWGNVAKKPIKRCWCKESDQKNYWKNETRRRWWQEECWSSRKRKEMQWMRNKETVDEHRFPPFLLPVVHLLSGSRLLLRPGLRPSQSRGENTVNGVLFIAWLSTVLLVASCHPLHQCAPPSHTIACPPAAEYVRYLWFYNAPRQPSILCH